MDRVANEKSDIQLDNYFLDEVRNFHSFLLHLFDNESEGDGGPVTFTFNRFQTVVFRYLSRAPLFFNRHEQTGEKTIPCEYNTH